MSDAGATIRSARSLEVRYPPTSVGGSVAYSVAGDARITIVMSANQPACRSPALSFLIVVAVEGHGTAPSRRCHGPASSASFMGLLGGFHSRASVRLG